MRMVRLILMFGAVAAAGVTTPAMQPMLDAQAVQDALALGQSRLSVERSRFHQPYRVIVNAAPIDYVEVVTPFRRIVLAAETRSAAGDRSFGQRQALELLGAAGDQLDVYVELTFHPLNTYVGVPAYDVALLPAGSARRLLPRSIDRLARYGARVEGLPLPLPAPAPTAAIRQAPSQPILGATLIARFDSAALDGAANYVVTVAEQEREVARAVIPLGQMR